jgi:hypothetical protein
VSLDIKFMKMVAKVKDMYAREFFDVHNVGGCPAEAVFWSWRGRGRRAAI